MSISINYTTPSEVKEGTLVLGISKDNEFSSTAKKWDETTNGALAQAIANSHFKGNPAQVLSIPSPQGTNLSQIILVGLGQPKTTKDLTKIGSAIATAFAKSPTKKATVHIDGMDKVSAEEASAHIAIGAKLKAWRFDKYHTKKKPEEKSALQELTFQTEKASEAEKLFAYEDKVVEGAFFTRTLVSEPGNVMYPKVLADAAASLKEDGIEVEILNEAEMKELGMGSLLGVGQGSERESYLAIMKWNGADKKDEAPLAFVGKGVTFDSGGISLKPGAGMEEMKWDMGGAAVVIGTMKALASRKAKVNAVGVIGLVENMPSGSAQRPGDVVKSMSGQTIEIINTDAEGRLVLADALWYTQDRFNPKLIIDLATLTMAVVLALGYERAGIFSNNDDLSEKLGKAGDDTGELVWRLPTDDYFDKEINSEIADMKNMGSTRGASSTTAAKFLERFVNGVPWAHLDIAGTTWANKDWTLCVKGASGFGVRLLDRFVRDNYES